MRVNMFAALAAAGGLILPLFPARAKAEPAPEISGPAVYENLAIYFVHGQSAEGTVPLTLQEAMERGSVRVIETGSVNELKVENLGGEDVFIQSGDIVKGGRQDRVLTASFVLPKNSGEIPIAAYCVEHGRWSKRGSEDAAHFSSSLNALPSRAAKLAMRAAAPAKAAGPVREAVSQASATASRQQAMWDEVSNMQNKLAGGIDAPVASPVSSSSLELTIENEKLAAHRAEYLKALEDKADESSIVGFVFAVNGRINSADIYPSNGLFRKMWPKLLAAAITEALGEKANGAAGPAPSIEAVENFLKVSSEARTNAQDIGSLARETSRDSSSVLYIEAATPAGQWLHRNYLAK